MHVQNSEFDKFFVAWDRQRNFLKLGRKVQEVECIAKKKMKTKKYKIYQNLRL